MWGLIEDALRDPGSGTRKPEALGHVLQGALARRISEEHRLAYPADGNDVVVLQADCHCS